MQNTGMVPFFKWLTFRLLKGRGTEKFTEAEYKGHLDIRASFYFGSAEFRRSTVGGWLCHFSKNGEQHLRKYSNDASQ
jgi:hypothetical protein